MTPAMTRPVKVLVVSRGLGIGGTETHLMSVLPALDRRQVQVVLFVLEANPVFDAEVESMGVRVVVGSHSRQGLIRVLRAALSFLPLMWRFRPDVVHCFLPEAYLFAALMSYLGPVRRRLMSRRSLNDYQSRYPLLARLERWLHQRIDGALGNSRAVAQELAEEGLRIERIGLLPNGIALERYRVNRDAAVRRIRLGLKVPGSAPVIGIFARLMPFKGHAVLLQALAMVREQLPQDWRLLICGRDCGIQADLERQAEALGLSERVLWLGERRDVPDLLATCAIGVLSSTHHEGLSNSLLEGMASGVAMVATDVSGSRDAVHDGVNGILVPPGDPLALGTAIAGLINDPMRRARIAAAGIERATVAFSLERCVGDYERLYAGVSAEPPCALEAMFPWR